MTLVGIAQVVLAGGFAATKAVGATSCSSREVMDGESLQRIGNGARQFRSKRKPHAFHGAVALTATLTATGAVLGVCFLTTHGGDADSTSIATCDICVLACVLVCELAAIASGAIVASRIRTDEAEAS